jgi:hypothetical protein
LLYASREMASASVRSSALRRLIGAFNVQGRDT